MSSSIGPEIKDALAAAATLADSEEAPAGEGSAGGPAQPAADRQNLTSALPSPLASSPASSALASRSGSVTSSVPAFGFDAASVGGGGGMQQVPPYLLQGQPSGIPPFSAAATATKAPAAAAAKPSVARRQHKLAIMRAAAAAGATGADYGRLQQEVMARASSVAVTNGWTLLQVVLGVGLGIAGFELHDVVAQALFYTCCTISVIGTIVTLTSMSFFAPRALCGGRSGKKRRRSRVGDATGCLQQTIKRFNAAMFVAGWLGLGTSLLLMFILVNLHAELYLWATWSFYGIVGGIGAWALIGQGLVLPACGRLGRCVRKGS